MPDRVVGPAGEALAAGEVVEREGVLRVGLDQLAALLDHGLVVAGHVEAVERAPDLPAADLVRLARDAADCDERRPRLFGERRPLHPGSDEDEGAGRRVQALAVELEPRATLLDEVQLLLLVVRLVVLVDQPVSRLTRCPAVDAEGGDPEVVPDRPHRLPPVVYLLDLAEVCHLVSAHVRPPVAPSNWRLPETPRWPVPDVRPPDDVPSADGAPASGVAGHRPIVAEDEVRVCWNPRPRPGVCSAVTGGDVWLAQPRAVDPNVAIPHRHMLAWEPDNALHESAASRAHRLRLPARFEHDDVPAFRVVKAVDESVGDHSI